MTDANDIQNRASDPRHSVWVGASAGTGKTKVLTDRVLRLLLDGNLPSRITCITYTKAAAKEMEDRIQATLIRWVAMGEDKLTSALTVLMGRKPSATHMERARHLFAKVLDAPEGVRIQTIHSFCQSILKRFPLEAGVSPHFTVLDDWDKEQMFQEVRHRVLLADDSTFDAAVVEALAGLRAGNDAFDDWLKFIIDKRHELQEAMGDGGATPLISKIYARFGLAPDAGKDAVLANHYPMDSAWAERMRTVADALATYGTNTLQALAGQMREVLTLPESQRREAFDVWWNMLYTTTGTPRKITGKALEQQAPYAIEALQREQHQLETARDALQALEVASRTRHVLTLADALLQSYEKRKQREQVLDFDDILRKADALFRQDGIAGWVLYKLDGGIDHLLIDEAQDTSPIQWRIVEKLVEEFFAGQGRGHKNRTLFVVGDEKQSIYSFQGARPKGFAQMRDHFAVKCKESGHDFLKLPMTTSFRTVPAVLDVVDATIAQPHIHQSISFEETPLPHYPHRKGQAGEVALWLLPEPAKTQADDGMVLRIQPVDEEEGDEEQKKDAQQAVFIARKIAGWLENGEMLASKNRPIRAGDIMVLVRNRAGGFIPRLMAELKRRHIPVGGADRIRLLENIAVQDMLALADFLLLPEDDLQLAAVLKSPLFGVDEEELFTLCVSRGDKSLWQALRDAAHPVYDALLSLLNRADMLRPYELFSHVLEAEGGRAKMAARLGHWAFEPLDEFLSLCLQFEYHHVPSLQGFLAFMRSSDAEVKRDMEQGEGFVRIMTVHNSKGLQAPIVILPKTEKNPVEPPKGICPLWERVDDSALFFAGQSGKTLPKALKAIIEANQQKQLEEEYRLLYVAMTRAEDRLYLAATPKLHENSWFSVVQAGGAELWQQGAEEGAECLRYTTVQQAATLAQKAVVDAEEAYDIPAFLRQIAPLEPHPPRPLSPSQFDDDLHGEGAMQSQHLFSPVEEALPLERGIYMHTMLQYLPATPQEARAGAALRYLERHAGHVLLAERERWVAEVLQVLEHPQFSHVFSGDAWAEVPVSGVVALPSGSKVVSGRIDRLKVAENGVFIVDFKTQRHPPRTLAEVPQAYVKQMALYSALLAQIYPNLPVFCALLWTAEVLILPIPPEMLAQYLDGAIV